MVKWDQETRKVGIKILFDWYVEKHLMEFREVKVWWEEKGALSEAEVKEFNYDYKEYIQKMYEIFENDREKWILCSFSIIEEMVDEMLPNNWWTVFRKVEYLDHSFSIPDEEERKRLEAELLKAIELEKAGISEN